MDYTKYEGFAHDNADPTILLDSRGTLRTQSLFVEAIQPSSKKRYTPMYNLSDKDRLSEGLISAYHVYMNSVDEYDAAMRLVGSMKHWRRLCNCKWFVEGDKSKGYEGLEQWREDMADRDASYAKRGIMASAKKGDTGAARLLLDINSRLAKRPVGRPNAKADAQEKEDAQDEADRQAAIEKLHEGMSDGGTN